MTTYWLVAQRDFSSYQSSYPSLDRFAWSFRRSEIISAKSLQIVQFVVTKICFLLENCNSFLSSKTSCFTRADCWLFNIAQSFADGAAMKAREILLIGLLNRLLVRLQAAPLFSSPVWIESVKRKISMLSHPCMASIFVRSFIHAYIQRYLFCSL